MRSVSRALGRRGWWAVPRDSPRGGLQVTRWRIHPPCRDAASEGAAVPMENDFGWGPARGWGGPVLASYGRPMESDQGNYSADAKADVIDI